MWGQVAELRVLVSESEGRTCAPLCWSLSDSPGGAPGAWGGTVGSQLTPGQRLLEVRLAPSGDQVPGPHTVPAQLLVSFYFTECLLKPQMTFESRKSTIEHVRVTQQSPRAHGPHMPGLARAVPLSWGAPAPHWEVTHFFLCICFFLAVLALTRPHSAKPTSGWGQEGPAASQWASQEEAWAFAGSGPSQAPPGVS